MNYKEKLKYVREFIFDNIDSVEQFCVLFDITLEDVVNCFPDKLVINYERIALEFPDEDKEEDEAWGFFSIIEPEKGRRGSDKETSFE